MGHNYTELELSFAGLHVSLQIFIPNLILIQPTRSAGSSLVRVRHVSFYEMFFTSVHSKRSMIHVDWSPRWNNLLSSSHCVLHSARTELRLPFMPK